MRLNLSPKITCKIPVSCVPRGPEIIVCEECGVPLDENPPEAEEIVCRNCGLVAFEGIRLSHQSSSHPEKSPRDSAPLAAEFSITPFQEAASRDAILWYRAGVRFQTLGSRLTRLARINRQYCTITNRNTGKPDRLSGILHLTIVNALQKLNLPKRFAAEITAGFQRIKNEDRISRGQTIPLLAAICILLCRNRGIYRRIGDVSLAFGTDLSRVFRAIRVAKICVCSPLSAGPEMILNLASNTISILGLPEEYLHLVRMITENIREKDPQLQLFSGKKPQGIAGGLLLTAADLLAARINLKALSSALHVCESTLTSRHHELRKYVAHRITPEVALFFE